MKEEADFRMSFTPRPQLVQLTDVTRDYGAGIIGLRDVNLTIDRGVSCAVVGPSGSGKSTLLNILGLLDRPTNGHCQIQGQDMALASDRQRANARRDTCGFVFQDFHLLPHRSALENIMLGAYYTGLSRKRRAARAIGLGEYVGLSRRLSMPVNRLSGGERQRVAIACALMNRPPLLLCDEPTGNLDSRTSWMIMDLLLNLSSDTTVVVVTHDERIAERCQRIVRVLDGCVTDETSFSATTDDEEWL